jgi:hypothetical protein
MGARILGGGGKLSNRYVHGGDIYGEEFGADRGRLGSRSSIVNIGQNRRRVSFLWKGHNPSSHAMFAILLIFEEKKYKFKMKTNIPSRQFNISHTLLY